VQSSTAARRVAAAARRVAATVRCRSVIESPGVNRYVLVGVVLFAAAMGALVAARGRAGGGQGAPRPGRAALPAPPAAQPRVAGEAFVGVLFARQQVDLGSSAQAVVETIPVQLGSHVARGAVIATLDADAVRRERAAAAAAVRAASADLAAAKVAHAAATEKAQRLSLYREGLPGEEITEARTNEQLSATKVAGALARLAGETARLEELRVLVENAAIVAPFDGVIAARYVDPGALVGPGKPIARLISGDDLWVRFAIPEERAGTARERSCVRVALRSPDLTLPGTVEMVAPQVDGSLRMILAEARLAVPAAWRGKLPAGLAADVTPAGCGPS
jgi:RND family efflux transporter MFP subunit